MSFVFSGSVASVVAVAAVVVAAVVVVIVGVARSEWLCVSVFLSGSLAAVCCDAFLLSLANYCHDQGVAAVADTAVAAALLMLLPLQVVSLLSVLWWIALLVNHHACTD